MGRFYQLEEESILELIVSPAREIGKKVRRYASLCWECWGCSMELKRFKIIRMASGLGRQTTGGVMVYWMMKEENMLWMRIKW